MGWYEGDGLHGYGKVVYATGKIKEGLFEDWSFKVGVGKEDKLSSEDQNLVSK